MNDSNDPDPDCDCDFCIARREIKKYKGIIPDDAFNLMIALFMRWADADAQAELIQEISNSN